MVERTSARLPNVAALATMRSMKYIPPVALLLQMPITIASVSLATAADLPSGTAKGACAKDRETPVALAYAAAFVDQKDERKPTLLILSDKKLPTDKWTSESI